MPRRIRSTTVHPPALRELRVLRVADITPGLRRVTLTGEQLGAFTPTPGVDLPEFVSTGFDDDVRVLFPYPGETTPVLPIYKDGKLVPAKNPSPLGRYYTVRRFDATTRELDIDFVRHGVGVATTWAYRAEPGHIIHIGGPSASRGLPEGFDWLVVVADDTAVPAVARLLEELPEDARAQVFIEVAEPSHRQRLRELSGVTVTWLTRGIEGSALLDAVRAADWWQGRAYGWVAGEQSIVRDTRRHLVETRRVPKTDIDFVGYWKYAPVTTLTDDPALPSPDTKEDPAFDKFHEQSEILPPIAIRLAIGLGLGDLISRGVTTSDELARRTGTVEWALRKFLRYLETIELLDSDAGKYRLTESGQVLTNEWMIRILDPKGMTARLERGFLGLEESLRTGAASFASVTGQAYEDLRDDVAFESEFLDDQADGADYLVMPIATSAALADVAHLVVHSDVASVLAAAVTETHRRMHVTIVADGAKAAWLREDLARSIDDPGRRDRIDISADPAKADAILFVNELKRYPDASAVQLLAQTAKSLDQGARIVLLEEALDPDDIDDHDAEEDLLSLALHGSGYRTDHEIAALIADAGLIVAATEPIGWGDTLRTIIVGG